MWAWAEDIMAERNAPIILAALDVQRILRAVLDRDAAEALDILETVVRPQVDRALAPSHCRPTFELQGGEPPIAPPPLGQPNEGKP
jgi:hypothetical protein